MKHLKAIETLRVRYNEILNNLSHAIPESEKADMLRGIRLAIEALANPNFDCECESRVSLADAAKVLHRAYALASQERRSTINDRDSHYDVNDPFSAQGYGILTCHICELNNDMVNLESAIRILYKWDEDRGLDKE
ncbi:hypothetical protein [Vibrio phage vB_ValS_PJ32]|nr:hypothetical protein [Vibrio phage vB_ValS_PJ32]